MFDRVQLLVLGASGFVPRREERCHVLGHSQVRHPDRRNGLREGISAVVAPEGTRTPTPVLGRFKKGAFHIAMEAKVPLVPIVLRNAGELLWRGSLVIHPGTVDVCVLDPIPTDDWTLENLNERVEGVRGRYVETLEHWPGSSVR